MKHPVESLFWHDGIYLGAHSAHLMKGLVSQQMSYVADLNYALQMDSKYFPVRKRLVLGHKECRP